MNATELLQEALDDEDAEGVTEAIRQGADVNAIWDDQTTLSAAVQIANAALVKLLLAANADPNRSNDDATTALTWCTNAELTALLLDAGASARYEGRKAWFSSLHNAAVDGDVERLRLLLERGEGRCQLNQFDSFLSWTPLHQAANEGQCEAAQLLIDAGADPNLIDEDRIGDTAICLAARSGHVEMVKLLLANGADPALKIGLNSSALDVARENTDKPELLACIEEAIRQRGDKATSPG